MGNVLDAIENGEKKRNDGVYYALIGQLWRGKEDASIEEQFLVSDLNTLRRQKQHPFYRQSCEALDEENLKPADTSDRSSYNPGSSMASKTNESTIGKKRKARLESVAIDGKARASAEIAHLLPHSSNSARLYGPLVEAAVGLDLTAEHPPNKKLKQQILVHGLQVWNGDEEKYERQPFTGVKHCRTNMARLIAPKKYLDFNPSLLVIPIMNLEKVLGYQGGRYSVLVAAASPEVYEEIVLTKKYDLCTPEEIGVATKTLSSIVKGIAYTLVYETDDEDINKISTQKERNIIKKTKQDLGEKKTVRIPKTCARFRKLRVMKLYFDLDKDNAHQECDPFLLCVKAGVVWSSQMGQKTLPGCPLPHDCEECLELNLFECHCDTYDPEPQNLPLPTVISISNN